ncbi:nibrin-like [Amphibalanus amphitrite]|uniref:nibrin-like n=1 Tax=Amphibalanus amphitrite TaxID=1232801 RepID=UPI001C9243A7|nr:nibrin-like [Amphibalanus amphitrite]
MWVLSGNEKSPEVTHYLLCNRDILVGRRTDIRLEDDKSISRTHACIHISYRQEDVASPTSRGRVTLSDRSKYGTSVNGQRIEPQGDCTLSDGDVVTFGLQWNSWTLSWRPLAVVISLLSPSDRTALNAVLEELGGTLLSEWGPTVNYLVMNSFKMSVKAVLALASGTPVVKVQYLNEMLTCARSKMSPDVNPTDFEPAMDEPTLIGSGCTIGVAKERSTLFFGKRFVFAEEAQLKRMKQAIEMAGGTALLLSSCGLEAAELAERDVIIMHTELKTPEINKLKAVLKRARRRMVKDQEIGLAILRISMERDCNPAFDYSVSFVPPLASTQSQSMIGTVLAKETQSAFEPPAASQGPAAATPHQKRRFVPPTPPTPATGGAGSAAPAAPPAAAAAAPTAPAAPATPASRVVPAGAAIPPSPTSCRPSESEWLSGSEAKRRRRDPEQTGSSTLEAAVGPAPPSLEMLAATTPVTRRSRDPPAEEPQPLFKKPRLSETARPRSTSAADEDLFEFDLESGHRPPRPGRAPAPASPAPATTSAPAAAPNIKRGPSPVPETPASREPNASSSGQQQRTTVVKTEPPGDDDGWISSCRRTGPPPPPPPPAEDATVTPPKRDKMSVTEDGDASSLVHSCIRLQISDLICPRRPQTDMTAADTSISGPNFKRFKRSRQAPLCPRIIGGSDLYVGSRPRSAAPMTNGVGRPTNGLGRHDASDGEDDLPGDEPRQDDDDDMFRLLDSVGRNRNARRR